jgi:hypothetical protein
MTLTTKGYARNLVEFFRTFARRRRAAAAEKTAREDQDFMEKKWGNTMPPEIGRGPL